jgi:DNA end-binding protein Ku
VTALRSLWNASLRLEQLVVPVALAATRSGGDDLKLFTLHRPCAHPLVQLRECPVHGQVPEAELAAGWQVSPGEFVLVEPDELDLALAPVTAERTLDVVQVVAAGDVDPVLVGASYFLMPNGGEYGLRGYKILATAIGAKDVCLIVRFAYRSEKIGAVRAVEGGALLLQVLGPVADRHPVEPIVEEVAEVEVTDAEFRLAGQLLRRKLEPLDEGLLVNHRRAALRGLLETKVAAGQEPVKSVPVANGRSEIVDGVDLEDALRLSLGMKPKAKTKRARAARAAA